MNHDTRRSFSIIALGAALLVPAVAAADPPPNGGPPGGRGHGPPQAAFDACANRTAGAACSVQLPDRTLEGTCATFGDGRLACRPDGMPPHGGPPPGGGASPQP